MVRKAGRPSSIFRETYVADIAKHWAVKFRDHQRVRFQLSPIKTRGRCRLRFSGSAIVCSPSVNAIAKPTPRPSFIFVSCICGTRSVAKSSHSRAFNIPSFGSLSATGSLQSFFD